MGGIRAGIGLWLKEESFEVEQRVQKSDHVLELAVDVQCRAR